MNESFLNKESLNDTFLNVLSIDIGIINLGYTYSKVVLSDYSKYFSPLLRKLNRGVQLLFRINKK